MNEKMDKKQLTLTIVAVVTLIALVAGAAYAYFAVGTQNNFGTTNINATAESVGSVALTKTGNGIFLNLSAVNMMKQYDNETPIDITYYGVDTPTGAPATTMNRIPIGTASVTGEGNYTCTYSLTVTNANSSATNNMYTAFQNWKTNGYYENEKLVSASSDATTGQIVLNVGGTEYDFYNANVFNTKATGTLSNITSENSKTIEAYMYVKNDGNKNQNAIAGTEINIEVTVDSFNCTAVEDVLNYTHKEMPIFKNLKSDLNDINKSETAYLGNAPYSYINTDFYSGKTITKIGIPVKSVSALNGNQTFTLYILKKDGIEIGNHSTIVNSYELKLPLEQIGNSTTVNKWIYVDLLPYNITLNDDETLGFGSTTDTVSWGFSNSNIKDDYKFLATTTTSCIGAGNFNILFDVYYNATVKQDEMEQRVFTNVLNDFSLEVSELNSSSPSGALYSYQDLTLFSGKTITKIGIPVKSVSAIDDNQTFTVKVFKNNINALKGSPVNTYQLKLPQNELGSNKDEVNKWIYVDCNIPVGEDETLAFNDSNDNVIFGYTSNGYINSKYYFYEYVGTNNARLSAWPANNLIFDIHAKWTEYIDINETENNLIKKMSDKKMSVFGDSISTYNSYNNNINANISTKDNLVFYDGSNSGVSNVAQTWWMKTINATGMNLLVNNSSSGSKVFGKGGMSTNVDQGIGIRSENLHTNNGTNPDIIAVYMGTNDANAGSTVGTYSESLYNNIITDNGNGTYSYIEPTTFVEAYIIMMHKIITKYNNADVYCMTLLPNGLISESNITPYNNIIRQVANHYNLTVVDLYNDSGITYSNYSNYLSSDNLHPKETGMTAISDTFIKALEKNY